MGFGLILRISNTLRLMQGTRTAAIFEFLVWKLHAASIKRHIRAGLPRGQGRFLGRKNKVLLYIG